jgi:hypothetical protein
MPSVDSLASTFKTCCFCLRTADAEECTERRDGSTCLDAGGLNLQISPSALTFASINSSLQENRGEGSTLQGDARAGSELQMACPTDGRQLSDVSSPQGTCNQIFL